jgi:hypothetical protein
MRITVRALRTALFAVVWALVATHVASACNKTFVVYNHTDNSIVRLYVAPTTATSWEDNVLGSDNAIEPDTYKRINMSGDTRNLSLYDVRAVLDDGTRVQGGKINLCRAQSVHIYSDRVTYSQ